MCTVRSGSIVRAFRPPKAAAYWSCLPTVRSMSSISMVHAASASSGVAISLPAASATAFTAQTV